eukprot:scaffold11_cov257-Pinguiococcus_pyrenoidosus.AAC.45
MPRETPSGGHSSCSISSRGSSKLGSTGRVGASTSPTSTVRNRPCIELGFKAARMPLVLAGWQKSAKGILQSSSALGTACVAVAEAS